MKKIYAILLLPVLAGSCFAATYFPYNYGVNNWNWYGTACGDFSAAHMKCWRIMLSWRDTETSYGNYSYPSQLTAAIDNAYTSGCKLSLCIYDSPDWARSISNKMLSYSPSKYAEFVTAMLQYCHTRHAGLVVSVEVENEWPTGSDSSVGQSERDPSWYYSAILKAAYQAVQGFNSTYGQNVLVVIDGIWCAAYHHLDELYQLGCKGYFDRINFHYYLHEANSNDNGRPDDPADTSTLWHFITQLKYLKYLADDNGDPGNFIWLTEYGWRITDETAQANYSQYVIDNCRKSGFVDLAAVYLGSEPNDLMATIDESPVYRKKPLYNMIQAYGSQYPQWSAADKEDLTPLEASTITVRVANAGFELGDTSAWYGVGNGITADSSTKHTGSYSGRVTASDYCYTDYYPVEPGKLYEIIAWVKLQAADNEACNISLTYNQCYNGTGETISHPFNYSGVVDTRNYPGGWRKIRYMALVDADKNQLRALFGSTGTGTFWIDDLQIKPLNFSTQTVTGVPVLHVDNTSLDFGEVMINTTKTLSFGIKNYWEGTLTGTVTSDKSWISVSRNSFSGNNVPVTVTVDNGILKQRQGQSYGTVTVASNGGSQDVYVVMTGSGPALVPVIKIDKRLLDFGEIEDSRSGILTIDVENTGNATLYVSTVKSNAWLTVEPGVFSVDAGTAVPVTVTIENAQMKNDNYSGTIRFISNGGSSIDVAVAFTATCVLVKPNPVRLSSPLAGEGKVEGGITFFGDGIVPGKTKITIYTLSGTVVADLSAPDNVTAPMNGQLQNEITWTPSNLSPGIYIYTYESPKEKGAGKFTVVR